MDELLNDICFMLQSLNKYDDLIKQRLIILLSKYKIERASTEVAIYEGDVNEKLINTFLLNKKVKGCTERTIQAYELNNAPFLAGHSREQLKEGGENE